MLNVKNFSFSYNDSKFLHDVNFSIDKGKLTAFIGKNGSGKSTIFKCLLSLYKSYKGNIEIDGIDIKKLNIYDLSKKIAYIPQKNNLVFNHSVNTIILMGTSNQFNIFDKPNEKQKKLVADVIDLLDIKYIEHKSFNKISGGEQQLVLIARALVQKTDYIIMDEPTSALDYYNQEIVMKKISELVKSKNLGVLISLHNPNLVVKYSDEVIALSNGTIIENGKTKEVLNEKLIKTLFDVNTKFYNTENGVFIQSIL